MHMVRQKNSGFTIVELLIVIVVIGILAAIVIVAFNGAQQRAKNANTLAVVKQYETAYRMYMADKGVYPAAATACLGEGYVRLCFGRSSDAIDGGMERILRYSGK